MSDTCLNMVLVAGDQIYREQIELTIDAIDHLYVIQCEAVFGYAVVAFSDVFSGIHINLLVREVDWTGIKFPLVRKKIGSMLPL